MKKMRLLTPGPTTIPEQVLAKFAEPIVHHRTSIFENHFREFQEHLQWLFETDQPVLALASTGTGAMDATITNLFSPGDEVIFVNGGKFGERWGDIAKAYGLSAHEIKLERGYAVTLEQIESAYQSHPHSKAILFQASETSTGVTMPVREISEFCQKHNLLSVCDGITAVGIFKLPMDEWKIDALITGSQKALMLPPGLALVAFSEKAWQAAETSRCPKYYFNLNKEKKGQAKQQTSWTPAISLIEGGAVALKMIRDEGREAFYRNHEVLGACMRAAVTAIGLELFSQTPSPVLTTVKIPQKFTTEQGKCIQEVMQEKFGVIVMGGQDELAGKILRLAHFGYCDVFDIASGIGALEMTLQEMGHPFSLGSGVGAIFKEYRALT